MDDFHALQIFNNDKLLDIYLCQIFLQVMTLSDVTNAVGKYISVEIFEGSRPSNHFSLHQWP
jgi:hypothetical protein